MKKTIIAIAAIGLMGSSVAFADSFGAQTDPFHNHAYVGAQGSFYKVKQHSVYTDHGSNDMGNSRSTNDGYMVGGYAGYGTDFSNGLYLGAEVGAAFQTKKPKPGTNGVGNPGTLLSTPAQYYLDLMPGYKVSNNLLIYGRVGVAMSKYTLERYDNDHSLMPYDNNKKTDFGLRLGVGAEYAVTNNLSVRAGATYVMMKKMTFNQHYNSSSKYAGYYSGTTTANPHYMMFNLGVSYRFGL